MYQYQPHKLRFKNSENHGFDSWDTKNDSKCKKHKTCQNYVEGKCWHSKGRWNASQSINPLISATFSLMSPEGGIRLDLAQSFLEKGCVCTDKPQSSRRALSAALPWSTGYLFPSQPSPAETFTKFCLMLSLYPLKSIFCSKLKRVGKGGGLATSSRGCIGMCGTSWGKLSLRWAIKMQLAILPAEEFTEFGANYYQV